MKEKHVIVCLIFIVPLVVAIPIIVLRGSPASASAFDPGVGIMTASNNIFQSDNYSLGGTIASLIYSSDVPYILSGSWSLIVHSNKVTNFIANISEVKADGSDSQKIVLTNFVSENTMGANNNSNHSLIFTGSLDIMGENQTKHNVSAFITIENFKAMNIVLRYTAAGSLHAGQPIYGTVNRPSLNSLFPTPSAGSNMLLPEGSGTSILGNSIPNLQLPQLPKPALR